MTYRRLACDFRLQRLTDLSLGILSAALSAQFCAPYALIASTNPLTPRIAITRVML